MKSASGPGPTDCRREGHASRASEEEVQEKIDEENERLFRDAQEQYTAESGAELKSRCHELTLEKRRTQEQARKVRSAIGERFPAELVNIL